MSCAQVAHPEELELRLRRTGGEADGTIHWQADLVDTRDGASIHFDSLPELIRWLAQLEWNDTAPGGLR